MLEFQPQKFIPSQRLETSPSPPLSLQSIAVTRKAFTYRIPHSVGRTYTVTTARKSKGIQENARMSKQTYCSVQVKASIFFPFTESYTTTIIEQLGGEKKKKSPGSPLHCHARLCPDFEK
ncbi:uncharacterized protein TrAtP1_005444 [Trichoderma atroviride]|uniref:uncharacterized protein n=1 Tax=Hypocrea atroviridis TaxID=63577 RepID=UPI00331B0C44|nr:hypothetical protein TrAtP1_005444 [Trichoderma atroviride]